MNILLINTVCGTGSTGRITVDYYNQYKSEGNNVKVIYGRGKNIGVPDEDSICFNTKIDLYYHALMSRLFDSQGLHSKRATKKMIKFIKDFAPDMIHLHNIHGYFLNYKMLFKYLNSTDIKIIWTFHDCWPFTGHCSHYLFNKCDKWLSLCKNCKFKNEYPKSILFDKSKRNFLLKKQLFASNKNIEILTPSQWLADEVEKSFLSDKKIDVINNKIDLQIFKPTPSNLKEELGIENNKKVILGVSNVWTVKKGYNYFFKLAESIDNNKYAIIMVGVSDKQMKSLPKNIIGIKRTHSKEELAKLYSIADIFFNPTLEDNYPTVNLEAQACGTKIVCFKGTGGGEEIVDNNGKVINIDEFEQFLTNIDEYI